MHFLKLRQSLTETLDLSIRVGYLARKPWGPHLIPQHCDYKHPPPSLAFYMGAKDRTCTWVVSTFQLRYLPSWLRTVMFKMVHPLPLVLISNVPGWNVYLICPCFLRVPCPVWNAPLSKHVLQPDVRVRLPRTGNLALWFPRFSTLGDLLNFCISGLLYYYQMWMEPMSTLLNCKN